MRPVLRGTGGRWLQQVIAFVVGVGHAGRRGGVEETQAWANGRAWGTIVRGQENRYAAPSHHGRLE